MATNIAGLLGPDADNLLGHVCKTWPKEKLHLPGPDFVERVTMASDRSNQVLVNLAWLYRHGRLGGTGYLSLLPVDQGVEHSGGASFGRLACTQEASTTVSPQRAITEPPACLARSPVSNEIILSPTFSSSRTILGSVIGLFP